MANKKDYTEEFLTEFRNIEQLLQQLYGPNTTFRDVEQKLEAKGDTDVTKKMYVLRVMRNYASHNPDMNTFMPVSEESCVYMRKLYDMFKREITTVKDSMSRTKPLSIQDNIVQGAKRLLKLPAIPVVDNNGIMLGVFNSDVLKKCVSEEMSLKMRFGKDVVKLAQIPNRSCVMQNMPMKDVFETMSDCGLDMMFVTDDGTSKGKFIGTVVK